MAQCFFCQRDEPLTRAHLLQKRFRESIRAAEIPVSLAASSVNTLGTYRDVIHNGDIRKTYVTSLCSDCNNNWMNSIEVAAAPVFEAIMEDKGFPPVPDLFKLAHWASVVGALSSELFSQLEIPLEHRNAIRRTRTGQAKDHSTYFIWTADYLESIELALYRGATLDVNGAESASWFSVLRSGPLVIISASEFYGARVARLLREHEIGSVLGALSSNLLYVSPGLEEAARGSRGRPTHADVQRVERVVAGSALKFVKTRGSELVDFSAGLTMVTEDLGFDFTDCLGDVRDQIDLKYLQEVFF